MSTSDNLVKQATQILRQNDRGGYTIPTDGLYPFQWNWDAGISALGWATFDEPRAWKELAMLFKGQWENGMVPHIVFHGEPGDYFPGPDVWGVDRRPPTSSITQPPLLATVARTLYERSADKTYARSCVQELLPMLVRYHRYCYKNRDPERSGLVTSYHPWESGMDNSPAWDRPLERVPALGKEYTRTDLQYVDSEERPLKGEYDRWLYLVNLFKESKFDDEAIYRKSPFKVQDVGLNAVLLRANDDLLALCQALGYSDDISDLVDFGKSARAAIMELWSEKHACFMSRDLVTGQLIEVRSTAGLLPLYAQAASQEQARLMIDQLEQWLDLAPFGVASVHPSETCFDAKRYWRGPSWLHINWMIAIGLEAYGASPTSDRIKRASADCIRTNGFSEYYDSLSGTGCGGRDFSWTAAIALYWLL